MEKAKKKGNGRKLSTKLSLARKEEEKFRELSNNMNTLVSWMEHDVSLQILWKLCKLQRYSRGCSAYYENSKSLRRILKHKFYDLQEDVLQAMSSTPKASSADENLHSRLSNYFFLRKQIGHKYLELLRFYLNHTPFLRSAKPERVGKTASELLSGKKHPHWLEMLGFKRFQPAVWDNYSISIEQIKLHHPGMIIRWSTRG